MAQKFVSLDDAAKQLGVSKDRLNELREAGRVRAYRDGAGWKFRTDDVEKLATDGIPAAEPPASDVGLESDQPTTPVSAAAGPASDIDLDLGLDEPLASAAHSDLGLEDLDEPTVPVEGTGDDDIMDLSAEDDLSDISDSILLSENELGESTDRPPSTIIGKAEMSADLDLNLAPSDSDVPKSAVAKPAPAGKGGKAKTPPAEAALDIEPPGLSDSFGDLQELEIDLEAESSRILAPEDVAKAKQAAAKPAPQTARQPKKATPKASDLSDLDLAPSDSSPGVLDSGVGGSGAISGISSLELESSSDDEVLGDGSDITLSSESSGINIISPSDSGLALDEVPLELSGASGMGSSLDLGKAGDDEVDLEPLDITVDESGISTAGEPFALTPFGEDLGDEDSSQVIPLDEVSEEDAAGEILGVGVGEGEGLGDDFATAGLTAGTIAPLEPVSETPFSVANVVGLGMCLLLLAICGMMMVDLVRNIWSWDQVSTLNSTILQVLNPFLS
ncbi:MAG TPA: excisionase family DNA-binding protein [Lacipirellulaceae bacterium]|jgi:excisionase family DNA binding protein